MYGQNTKLEHAILISAGMTTSNNLNAFKCKVNGEILSILCGEPWLYITIFVRFDMSFAEF